MQFDVIIGNPPYQLDDGGFGTSARRSTSSSSSRQRRSSRGFLTMVIPARWFAGGKGLDEFRESMLTDDRLRSIDDYLNASDVFPGVGLKGGVCYFLWDRDNPGPVPRHDALQGLARLDRDPPAARRRRRRVHSLQRGLSILKKVVRWRRDSRHRWRCPTTSVSIDLVSSRSRSGSTTTFKGRPEEPRRPPRLSERRESGYVARVEITTGPSLIDKWKVYVGRAAPGTGNKDTYPHRIISTPFVGEPGKHLVGDLSLHRPVRLARRRPRASCPTCRVG